MLHTITHCTVLPTPPCAVCIEWRDGASNDFHALMLRDNCFCDECYDHAVGERIKLTSSISLNTCIKSVETTDDAVVIRWDDNHVSRYKSEWLRRNAYAFAPNEHVSPPNPWDRSFADNLPRFAYRELLTDERALITFLSLFRDYGISIVEGVPLKKNETERFANYLAYVREIVFDRVADIKVSADAYTQGFTDAALQPHTDCSGYQWPPNVFLFHCLENDVEGGESVYVDGQMVVDQLQDNHPEHFDFLSSTAVVFRLYSKNADTTTSAPIIILDEWGKLHIIRYVNWTVQPLRMSLNDTDRYYAAHNAISQLINAPENQLIIRVRPGEMMVVNNHRVLHGRSAFRMETGNRHFQQVYLEMDDLMGRLRNLRNAGADA